MDNLQLALRALEKKDLDDVLSIENDKRYWHLSGTTNPFTKEEIANYIENSDSSIDIYGQLRFVIEVNKQFTGLIDLYEYDEEKKVAGVGIIVFDIFQNKGIGKKAMQELIQYAKVLGLKRLFARTEADNAHSIQLFEGSGFKAEKYLKGYILKQNEPQDCKEFWIDL